MASYAHIHAAIHPTLPLRALSARPAELSLSQMCGEEEEEEGEGGGSEILLGQIPLIEVG